MKTIHYFLSACVCICIAACSSDTEQKQEPEDPCRDFDYEQEFVFHYGDLHSERLAYMGMDRPADSYNYPAYPGMDEWATFKTSDEMTAIQQVPDCLLSKMSTQAVIQAIWELPTCGRFFTTVSLIMK